MMYHGKAKLARVLQPTAPILVRPWVRFAWLMVAVILGAAIAATW